MEEQKKSPKRGIVIVMLLILLFALIVISSEMGKHMACDRTGKLINGKCFNVIDLGTCQDVLTKDRFILTSKVNYTAAHEIGLPINESSE